MKNYRPTRDWDPIPKPRWSDSDDALAEWTIDWLYHSSSLGEVSDYYCEFFEEFANEWSYIRAEKKRGRGRPHEVGARAIFAAARDVKRIRAHWSAHFGRMHRDKLAIKIAAFLWGVDFDHLDDYVLKGRRPKRQNTQQK
jgi:hypothetical protein